MRGVNGQSIVSPAEIASIPNETVLGNMLVHFCSSDALVVGIVASITQPVIGTHLGTYTGT